MFFNIFVDINPNSLIPISVPPSFVFVIRNLTKYVLPLYTLFDYNFESELFFITFVLFIYILQYIIRFNCPRY